MRCHDFENDDGALWPVKNGFHGIQLQQTGFGVLPDSPSTVFEVEFRWPKRAVIIFKIMTARPVLRNSTSMVVKIGASALAKTKSHGELERAVAKLVTTTEPDIRCVRSLF